MAAALFLCAWLFAAPDAIRDEPSFEATLRQREAVGAVPELTFSWQAAARLLGPTREAGPSLLLRGRHLRDLAPYAEGASNLFRALAQRAATRDDKTFFAEATREARENVLFSPLGGLARRSAFALHLWLAIAFGGAAWLLARRRAPVPSPRLAQAWLLVLGGALGASAFFAAEGLATLAASREAPSELFSGQLGSPSARAYLRGDGPIGALALALAGEVEGAERIYAEASDADAATNRAVLALLRGDKNQARSLFQRALAEKPNDIAASFGLWRAAGVMPPGEVASQHRFQRALRANAQALYALPQARDWERLFRARAQLGHPLESWRRLSSEHAWPALLPFGAGAAALTLALLLRDLRRARTAAPAATPRRWIGALCVPGSGHRFGVWLTILAAAYALALASQAMSGGIASTPLFAVAQPDFATIYGASAPDPSLLWLEQPGWALAIIWLVNGLFVWRSLKRGS